MTLQVKLDAIKSQMVTKFPPETVAIIQKAGEQLAQSGIMENVLKKGDKAPEFSLNDEKGNRVQLSELISGGTVIISFYRGVW